MGASWSRGVRPPLPTRELAYMPEREAGPLTTIDQLLGFVDPMLCAVEPLNLNIRRGRPEDPKTMFCHDMMGGYHEDRFIHGSQDSDPYRFHHWHAINTFVYYTHNLVTIPPPGWITAAHRHGVKVLGTFILESDEGVRIINTIKDSGLAPQLAEKLAHVASLGRFDGWLVSIGCKVNRSFVPFLKDLLETVTQKMHSAVPGSQVIWYDGVDSQGKATPQNELNEKNARFFDVCDGIFLNFRWKEDALQKSAQLAGDRRADVYVGIDVFARNTPYQGGYDLAKTVRTVREHGISAAIFGAGWVYEVERRKNFITNQYRLWDFADDICPELCFTAPPISTSFCQGFGNNLYSAGARVCSRPWFNLSKQQLQPRDQGNTLCSTCGSVTVCLRDAYNGGSCLRVLFRANEKHPEGIPYFRLFVCEFPLKSLTVSYTFKRINNKTSAGEDIALVIKAKTSSGGEEELVLGMFTAQPEGNNFVLRRDLNGKENPTSEIREPQWETRNYYVEDKRGAEGATLHEIGVRLTCAGVEANVCLLGQVDIKRPDEKNPDEDPDAVLEPSSEESYEPEEKRRRGGQP